MPHGLQFAHLQGAFEFDASGLESLLAWPRTNEATTFSTATGPVVAFHGRKLHSGRDPLIEARRFARELDLADVDIVVLLGFGSGYVARAIAERSGAHLVAFEPNLEILAEGLPHGPLPANLRIVTSPKSLGVALYSVLRQQTRGCVARWIPSVRTDPDTYAAAARVAAQSVDRASLVYRTTRLRVGGWLDHYLTNFPHLVDAPNLGMLRGEMRGAPFVIVAAGPSLDRNAHLLRDLVDRAVILSVNTAARALARAGVTPSAVVLVESLDISSQFEGIPWLSDVPAFIDLTAHPASWALPFASKLPMSVDTSSCARFSLTFSPGMFVGGGFCVANTSVALAHALGAGSITLVGSDLAYEAGQMYASGTVFERMRAEIGPDGSATIAGLEAKHAIEDRSQETVRHGRSPSRIRVMETPSWDLTRTVFSSGEFKMFRDWYEHSAPALRADGIELVNSTEGGSHIPGWPSLPLEPTLARLAPPCPAPEASVGRRFSKLTRQPGVPPQALLATLQAESDRVATLLRLGLEARALVRHDPDGDLALSGAHASRLSSLNDEVQSRFRDSPLAAEAVFNAVESLRERSEMNTFAMYEAMERPLTELATKLARLLQSLSAESERRAS